MRRLTVPDPSRVRESTPPRTNADESSPRPDTTLRLATRPDLRSKIPAPDPYRPHNPAPAIRRCSRSLATIPLAHEVIVLAGLGPTAQWYRNLVADNAAEFAIGRERFASPHRELDPPEAAAVLAQYKRRHRHITPVIRRKPPPRRSGESPTDDRRYVELLLAARRVHILVSRTAGARFGQDSSAYQPTPRTRLSAHRWPWIRHHRRSARHRSS